MTERGNIEPGYCLTLWRFQIVWWPDIADWRFSLGPLNLRFKRRARS
jgi:hypothetical protein